VVLQNLLHHLVVLEFVKRAKSLNVTLVEDDDLVSEFEVIDGVGGEDSGSTFAHTLNNFFKDSFSNSGIEGRDWIIEQDNVSVLIDSSSQSDTGLLTTREIDTLFTKLGLISSSQLLEIIN